MATYVSVSHSVVLPPRRGYLSAAVVAFTGVAVTAWGACGLRGTAMSRNPFPGWAGFSLSTWCQRTAGAVEEAMRC
ncbi:hypothetical protein [Streptomyces sp. NBC_00467]|uniref:hypothetical protein n=1 Tax=Streptomyces sp. NBC_00467 TaxID=2975752 RepID=UPI002E16CF7C